MAKTRDDSTRWRNRVFVLSLLVPNPTEIKREETNAELVAPGITTRAWSRRLAAATAAIPEQILVWEIFVRLPANDVLSCRAVCRRWRALTSANDFLLAHHRCQPPLLLLMQRGIESPDPILEGSHVVLGLDDDDDGFKFHASCDGLILLSLSDGTFSICNPATRQCAPLPGITTSAGRMDTAALYLHHPSDEYRVIYWEWRHPKNQLKAAAYYIFTVSDGHSHSPRCIRVPPCIEKAMMACYRTAPPVMFRNCLHWEPACSETGILVFDTVVESFSFMRRPADATGICTRLCDMEGSIFFSCFGYGRTAVKLWVLEDYEREVWSLKYHVKFPAVETCIREEPRHLVLSHEGDVLIYRSSGYMHHYDNTGKSLQSWSGNMRLIGLSFKESLVKHDFLPMQGCAWVGQPRFLQTP